MKGLKDKAPQPTEEIGEGFINFHLCLNPYIREGKKVVSAPFCYGTEK